MPSVDFARVLVLLEGRATELVPEYAVEFALRRGLQLVGLFVEDSDLLSSAGLPFTREVGAESGALRPLSRATVEQAMREDAEGLRAALERLAHERGFEAVFEVGRGPRKRTVLRRIRSGDLLVLCRGVGHRRPADMLDTLLREAPCMVMVFGAGEASRSSRPVVLVDGSTSGGRVLERALEAMGGRGGSLGLLVAPGGAARRAAEHAVRLAGERGVHCRPIHLPGLQTHQVLRALPTDPAPLLFIGRDSPLLAGQALGPGTDLSGVPLVVVP
mgnify:CR=1 FL=1